MNELKRNKLNNPENEESSISGSGGLQQSGDADDGLKSAEELEQAAKLVDAMEQPDSFEY
ncbi:hypothetical protein PSTEL_16695 [Paenibacillus stellifer]|uniref:Uncharacterized protein n=1 Tax=Paenibacillus stellifer TaxID=169760 RepID=A0A089LSJ2_9BACL|nr:hypothetical protein [Paenibacillus stellifer]AIQ64496.1 hypothetical protein PSTEL_16695 [Paenibacillus stellifer]